MDAFTVNEPGSGNSAETSSIMSQGQAALLLVETLMHALVTKGTLSRDEFIDIVDGAAEVEQELARDSSSFPYDASKSLLSPMAAAFERELGL